MRLYITRCIILLVFTHLFHPMTRHFCIIVLCLSAPSFSLLHAQTGGDNTYEFVNLPVSARLTALGGMLISVSDDDVSLAAANPAALHPTVDHQLSFNHRFFPSGIQSGYFGYGHYLPRWQTTLHGGIQYMNYGDFSLADEYGNVTGVFQAKELAFNLGGSRQLSEHYHLGANIRYISSRLESYRSAGLAADLAAMYRDTARRLGIALVFSNAGGQLTPYIPGQQEPLPFEIRMGISHRLKYLPLRLSATAHHLERWNIRYDDPDLATPGFLSDEEVQGPSAFAVGVDNFFRHMVFSGEILIGKRENLRIRFAYNHFRKKEMSINNLRSLAGFSGGFGLRISRFRLDYGYAAYHIAGGAHHLSISTDIDEFFGKVY